MRAAGISLLVYLTAAGAQAGAPASLSGGWLFGDALAEPRAPVVAIPPRCWSGGVDFRLADLGRRITGTARWIAPASGVPPTSEHEESETLAGTRDGDRITLTGEHRVVDVPLAYPSLPGGPPATVMTTVRYDLRLDRRTGHLVGTRDGQSFWLARFRVLRGACGSPPP